MHDLVIDGTSIVDVTDAPFVRSGVAGRGSRIAAAAVTPGEVTQAHLDAEGQAPAPVPVDPHTCAGGTVSQRAPLAARRAAAGQRRF